MYKLRAIMKQAKAELEEFGCLSKYGYKAGVHLQHKSMDFRSPFLESLIKDRNKEMTNKISVKGALLMYKTFSAQYNALKFCDYEFSINNTIFNSCTFNEFN